MKTAYFSCGAGDFIAIESFLTLVEKKEISEFVLFTRAARVIEKLIRLHPIWKNCAVIIPLTPDEIFSFGTYSFFTIPKMRAKTGQPWPALDGAIDYSGDIVYPKILSGKLKFTESLFEVEAIEVDVVCDPASNADDRLCAKGRNLTEDELKFVESISSQVKMLGIGETTIPEALGYVKGCREFYGVDSMLSVWAGRQTGINNIMVKTVNPTYIRWQPIYDPFKLIEVVDTIK